MKMYLRCISVTARLMLIKAISGLDYYSECNTDIVNGFYFTDSVLHALFMVVQSTAQSNFTQSALYSVALRATMQQKYDDTH